jgi:membrane-bound ClpP family serine protease
MTDDLVGSGTIILLGIIFIIGGFVMLTSKMTPEKEAMNKRMGGTY